MARNVSVLWALVAVAAAGTLAACDRESADKAQRSGAEVGQKIDEAIDRTQQKLAEAGEKTQETLSQAGDRLQPKIAAAGERIAEATDKVAANVKEAVKPDANAGAGKAGNGAGTATDAGARPASRAITTTITTGPETSVSGLPAGTREALTDTAISTAIKARFVKDPGLSVLRIEVDTRDGVVTLNGFAEDEAARERAARIAAETRGVKEVRNHLTVRRG